LKSRIKLVSLALVSAVALSGCSFSREVTSLLPYSPSDGNQTDIEMVKARNFMVISADGVSGVVIGSLVNDGQQSAIAEVQFVQSNGERVSRSFEIASGRKVDIGYNGSEPMPIQIDVIPGSLVTLFFVVDGVSSSLEVPVLDGSLAEYRPFIQG
jgi:hypothetical protein